MLQFNLQDTTGQKYTEAFTGFAKAPEGKVEAGDPLRGQLAYEVPTNTKKFMFSFQSDVMSSGQTLWNIIAP